MSSNENFGDKNDEEKKDKKDKGDEVVDPKYGKTRPATPNERKGKQIVINDGGNENTKSAKSDTNSKSASKPAKTGTPVWGKIKMPDQELKVKFVTVGECSFNKLDGWFRLEPVENASKASDEFGVDFKDHQYTVKLQPLGEKPEYELIMTRKNKPPVDLPKSGVIHVTYPFQSTSAAAAEAEAQALKEPKRKTSAASNQRSSISSKGSVVKKFSDESHRDDVIAGNILPNFDIEELDPVCIKMMPESKSTLDPTIWQKQTRKRLSKFSLVNADKMYLGDLNKNDIYWQLKNVMQLSIQNIILRMAKTINFVVKEWRKLFGGLLKEFQFPLPIFSESVKCLPAEQNNDNLLDEKKNSEIIIKNTHKELCRTPLRVIKKKSIFTYSLFTDPNGATSKTQDLLLQSSLYKEIKKIEIDIKPLPIFRNETKLCDTDKINSTLKRNNKKNTDVLNLGWNEISNMINYMQNTHLYEGTKIKHNIKYFIAHLEIKNDIKSKSWKPCEVSRLRSTDLLLAQVKTIDHIIEKIRRFITKFKLKYYKTILQKYQLLIKTFQNQPNLYFENKFEQLLSQHWINKILFQETNYSLNENFRKLNNYHFNEVRNYKSRNKMYGFILENLFKHIFKTLEMCKSPNILKPDNKLNLSFTCNKQHNVLKCLDNTTELQFEYNMLKKVTLSNTLAKTKGDTRVDIVQEPAESTSSSTNRQGKSNETMSDSGASTSRDSMIDCVTDDDSDDSKSTQKDNKRNKKDKENKEKERQKKDKENKARREKDKKEKEKKDKKEKQEKKKRKEMKVKKEKQKKKEREKEREKEKKRKKKEQQREDARRIKERKQKEKEREKECIQAAQESKVKCKKKNNNGDDGSETLSECVSTVCSSHSEHVSGSELESRSSSKESKIEDHSRKKHKSKKESKSKKETKSKKEPKSKKSKTEMSQTRKSEMKESESNELEINDSESEVNSETNCKCMQSVTPESCRTLLSSSMSNKDSWFKMCPFVSNGKDSKPTTEATKNQSEGFFSKIISKLKAITTCNMRSQPSDNQFTENKMNSSEEDKPKSITTAVTGKFRVIANYDTGKLDIDVDRKSRKELMEVLSRFATDYDKNTKK